MNKATVIGAGLAGCEAAWQLANRNIKVDLYEMKPNKKALHTAIMDLPSLFAQTLCVQIPFRMPLVF